MVRIQNLIYVMLVAVIIMSGYVSTGSPVSAAGACTPTQLRQIEDRVHVLVNGERTSRGLAPVTRMQSIDQMAQDWSVTMYRNGSLEHRSDLLGPTPGSPWGVGENILYYGGYQCDVEADAQRSMSMWMNSQGHRDNILRSGYTHAGYGFYTEQSGSRVYGTQNFVTYSSGAPVATASIAISPTSGAAGSVVTVSGQGYSSGFQVELTFGPSNLPLGSVTTDANGSFVAKVTVPRVGGGSYLIRARVQNGQTYQDQTFRVVSESLATLSLSPRSVSPGGVVTFSGTNFQPGERVDIRWGSAYGEIIGYVTARSDGSISGAVTARGTSSGNYTIVARGTASSKAIGASVYVAGVTPLINASPSSVAAGSVVSFSGQGFTPGERVNITWDTHTGQLIGYVSARADGTIAGAVTVPANATSGSHYLYARGQSSTITVRRDISITAPMAKTTMVTEQTSITLGESDLAMGQTTTLTGQGFQPGEQVVVSAGQGVELVSIAADEDGRFRTTVTIPETLPYADQPQTLRATGAESRKQAEASFAITNWDRAEVMLSPEEGPVNTVTMVSARGYLPGEEVTIRVASSSGPLLATANADSSGTVVAEVMIPAPDETGTVSLVVVGADGVLLGAGIFTIADAIDLTPAPTEEPVATETPATPAPAETEVPTEEPTVTPVEEGVPSPTPEPVVEPTAEPTEVPVDEPVTEPDGNPVEVPAGDQG